jgi:hypothetical protein
VGPSLAFAFRSIHAIKPFACSCASLIHTILCFLPSTLISVRQGQISLCEGTRNRPINNVPFRQSLRNVQRVLKDFMKDLLEEFNCNSCTVVPRMRRTLTLYYTAIAPKDYANLSTDLDRNLRTEQLSPNPSACISCSAISTSLLRFLLACAATGAGLLRFRPGFPLTTGASFASRFNFASTISS